MLVRLEGPCFHSNLMNLSYVKVQKRDAQTDFKCIRWHLQILQGYRPDMCLPNLQVVVHNLPWSITWQELKDIFSHTPGVVRADVIIDATGRSRYATFHILLALISSPRICILHGALIKSLKGRIPLSHHNSLERTTDFPHYIFLYFSKE